MSQTEQQFDSLCMFADKLSSYLLIGVTLDCDNVLIEIVLREPRKVLNTFTGTPYQALTEALRYLRKISKQQNKKS